MTASSSIAETFGLEEGSTVEIERWLSTRLGRSVVDGRRIPDHSTLQSKATNPAPSTLVTVAMVSGIL